MKLIAFVQSYLATLHRDTKGATAIEYAVIAGLMAAALILAVAVLAGSGAEGEAAGTGITGFFDKIGSTLNGLAL